MRSSPILISALCLLGLSTACEDLGECKDETKGRRPISVGGQVMYAGQAVILQTCASCHSENSTGAVRGGAPAGLDFDIQPVSATQQNADGSAVVDEAALARLRAMQRKVFEEREGIWKQVAKDLMPPKGTSDALRKLNVGQMLAGLSGGKCVLSDNLGPISEDYAKEEVRNWLACGAPIVEVNAAFLTEVKPGTVGDQFPFCEDDAPPTFEKLYADVFEGGTCTGCHGVIEPSFDISTPEKAWVALMGEDGQGASHSCATSSMPMITPNDPENSYLIAKVGDDASKRCNARMPTPGGLSAPQEKLLRDWINAGAPGPVQSADSSEP